MKHGYYIKKTFLNPPPSPPDLSVLPSTHSFTVSLDPYEGGKTDMNILSRAEDATATYSQLFPQYESLQEPHCPLQKEFVSGQG